MAYDKRDERLCGHAWATPVSPPETQLAMVTPAPYPVGLDYRPRRPWLVTIVLFLVVVLFAATLASGFKLAAERTLKLFTGATGPVAAARSLSGIVVAIIVTVAVVVAATLGHWSHAKWADRLGVEAVAASARGEDRRISVQASSWRIAATWLVTVGMASIGRETAIIEGSGSFGSAVGRRTGGRGDAMAAAGIAAGFSAAYHAPVAAVLYLEEHLNVRRSRRGLLFSIAGSAGGHLISTLVFGGHSLFPGLAGSWSSIALSGAIAVVPAVIGARLFLEARVRFDSKKLATRFANHPFLLTVLLAGVAGVSVAVFRDAAGNGMEALRAASGTATIGVAAALAIGKFVGTTAALAAGVPGGALTPTISVSAGFALLAYFGLCSLGFTPADPWAIAVAAMAAGLAVGLRAPLMAAVMVPELLGDYSLIPVLSAVVVVAWLIDRRIDRWLLRGGEQLPSGIHDEDG